MPFLWFKCGTSIKKVVQNPRGCYDLRSFKLDPSSIELNGFAGIVDADTCQTQPWFLLPGQGHSQDTAIEVTGKPDGAGPSSTGRVAHKKLTRFACALRDARVKEVGNGMQLLSFGPEAHFPDDTSKRRSDLLIRDFYSRLLEVIAAQPAGDSLLTGMPGTGKSWWIWYAVHQLLNQTPAPAIVWQSFKYSPLGQCVLFKDGQAFLGDLKAFQEELEEPSTWYFADGMLPAWVEARTVMVCSPKHEVYKEWVKGRDIAKIMPLWTWPEIEKLWEQLYQSKLPLERARRNFDKWFGGVPRLVLELPSTRPHDSEDATDALSAINTTSLDQVLVAVEGQFDACPETSHRIVHVLGDRETFRECGRQYATKHMEELLMAAALNHSTTSQVLGRLASCSNTNRTLRGQAYEALMHTAVCDGGSFEYKFVDVPCSVPASGVRGRPSSEHSATPQAELDKATLEAATAAGTAFGEPLQLHVPKQLQLLFKAGINKDIGEFGKAAKLASPGCYIMPATGGHPVIDACIFPDTLLNFKVASGTTGVDERVMEAHLQQLPDLPRYYFDYVVPTDAYSAFKPAQLKRDAAHPRVAKAYVRVVKVDAKLQVTVRAAVHSRMVHLVRGPCRFARCT